MSERPQQRVVSGLRSWSAAQWRMYGVRLVLELLVVFAGVYGASALADHQRAQQDAVRREQLALALIQEIDSITANTRNAPEEIHEILRTYKSSSNEGRYVPLRPYLSIPVFQQHIWQAALQSSAIDLFDVPTIVQLSQFYGLVDEGVAYTNQLRDLSERMLLPVLDAGPDEFYDLDSGAIRAKYAWYPGSLERLANLAHKITITGDRLVEELRTFGGRTGKTVGPDSTAARR